MIRHSLAGLLAVAVSRIYAMKLFRQTIWADGFPCGGPGRMGLAVISMCLFLIRPELLKGSSPRGTRLSARPIAAGRAFAVGCRGDVFKVDGVSLWF